MTLHLHYIPDSADPREAWAIHAHQLRRDYWRKPDDMAHWQSLETKLREAESHLRALDNEREYDDRRAYPDWPPIRGQDF